MVDILYNNINQGLIYYGQQNNPLRKFLKPPHLQLHLDSLNTFGEVDIAGFAEVLFDTEDGHSDFLDELSKNFNLPHIKYQINGPCYDDIDEIKGRYYGQAILSRFPILNYKIHEIPVPDIVNHESFIFGTAQRNKMPHIKYVQDVDLDVHGDVLKIYNVHSIPFHWFTHNGKRLSINDPKLKQWHEGFKAIFDIPNNQKTIIMGDFNILNMAIEDFLPELFQNEKIVNQVSFSDIEKTINFDRSKHPHASKLIYEDNQVDYLLNSPNLKLQNAQLMITPSDHPALYASLVL